MELAGYLVGIVSRLDVHAVALARHKFRIELRAHAKWWQSSGRYNFEHWIRFVPSDDVGNAARVATVYVRCVAYLEIRVLSNTTLGRV